MSYDIELLEPETEETIMLDEPHYLTGGTYQLGGTREAWLNITYNYSKYYYEHIDKEKGIRLLYGKTGAESIPILEKAISELGDEKSSDYWEATEGNAKEALRDLLVLAKARPDGVWSGD